MIVTHYMNLHKGKIVVYGEKVCHDLLYKRIVIELVKIMGILICLFESYDMSMFYMKSLFIVLLFILRVD